MDIVEAASRDDLLTAVSKELNSEKFKNAPVNPKRKGWTGPKPGSQEASHGYGHGYADSPENRKYDREIKKELKKKDIEKEATPEAVEKINRLYQNK